MKKKEGKKINKKVLFITLSSIAGVVLLTVLALLIIPKIVWSNTVIKAKGDEINNVPLATNTIENASDNSKNTLSIKPLFDNTVFADTNKIDFSNDSKNANSKYVGESIYAPILSSYDDLLKQAKSLRDTCYLTCSNVNEWNKDYRISYDVNSGEVAFESKVPHFRWNQFATFEHY